MCSNYSKKAQLPRLVEVIRSGLVESWHRGTVVLVDAQGNIQFSLGDADWITYPRSALKFVQVLPLLLSGAAEKFRFSDEEIAVMCASHNAEARHLEVVQSILHKSGIDASHLGCGTHPSLHEPTRDQYLREGTTLLPLHNNCSGKHAGFLALAKFLNAPLEGYLHPGHPVQVKVRELVCEVFELQESALHAGVDGCSAPNYAMPLRNQALGFARFAGEWNPDPGLRSAMDRVIRAVSNHAFMVGGSDRFCSELMEAAEGRVFGKLGASGMYLLGVPEKGLGAAIKIEDGLHGPQYQVVMEVLEALGVLPDRALKKLAHWRIRPVLNCLGKKVGEQKVVADVRSLIQAQ